MIAQLKRTIKKKLLKYITPENMLLLIHMKQMRQGMEFPFRRTVFIEHEAPEKKRILVLAPHQDDEVLGAGGALSRYKRMGNEILVAYMTDGASADTNANGAQMKEVRRHEAQRVCDTYGFKPQFLNCKDCGLTPDITTINTLKKILNDFNPHRIYCPSFLDSHPDHFNTNRVLSEALKATGKNPGIFGYEVQTNIPLPNYAVDITDQFETKKNMISVYESQTAIFDYVRLCESRDTLNHTMYIDPKNGGYTEIFIHYSSETYINYMQQLLETL